MAKMTPEKMAAFCAALASGAGRVDRACQVVGITRQTAYMWRRDNQAFAAEWDQARAIGLDSLEDEAIRRAYEGVERQVMVGGQLTSVRDYSDLLTIFLLKGARPERYRERIEHSVGVDVSAAILAARGRAATPAGPEALPAPATRPQLAPRAVLVAGRLDQAARVALERVTTLELRARQADKRAARADERAAAEPQSTERAEAAARARDTLRAARRALREARAVAKLARIDAREAASGRVPAAETTA